MRDQIDRGGKEKVKMEKWAWRKILYVGCSGKRKRLIQWQGLNIESRLNSDRRSRENLFFVSF
jgi:hypothetical protein